MLRVRNRNRPRRVAISPIRPRKARLGPPKKQPYHVTGGPLAGGCIWLCLDGITLPITVRGVSGYYRQGVWIPAGFEPTETTKGASL